MANLFIVGGIGSFLGSTLLCLFEINPFYKFYYIFAWYSYIFFIDGMIWQIKKESLIINRPADFIFMLITSIGLWFSFEIANISLKNWQYIMIPWDKVERYLGYFLSYATVLPILFETAELIETIGLFKNSTIKTINIDDKSAKKILAVGLILAVLSVSLPSIFFPLIWVAFIFIFDPINYLAGDNSFIDDIKKGYGVRIYTLFTSGMICGFLWELFNYKAGAKWIYNLPYLNNPKLFEMPIAGYLGFGFFSLECYAIYIFLQRLRRKAKSAIFYPLFLLSVIIISIISSVLIDRYTVRYFSL